MNVVTGKIIPIRDNVLIADMSFDEQTTASGIVLRSDDGTSEGIKPRWGKVWAIGPSQTDVKVGDWILVEHGRWTRSVTVEDENGNELIIRRVDIKAIMACSDYKPSDITIGLSNPSTKQEFDFSQPSFQE